MNGFMNFFRTLRAKRAEFGKNLLLECCLVFLWCFLLRNEWWESWLRRMTIFEIFSNELKTKLLIFFRGAFRALKNISNRQRRKCKWSFYNEVLKTRLWVLLWEDWKFSETLPIEFCKKVNFAHKTDKPAPASPGLSLSHTCNWDCVGGKLLF